MSEVMNVNDDSFQNEVLEAGTLAVVDFGAEWCGPCKKIHPIMDEIAKEMGDKVKVCYVDVAISPRVAQNYAVMSIPQVHFFKDGEPRDSIIGLTSKEKIMETINRLL